MTQKITLPNAVIQDTGTEKGLGVFANQDYQSGDIVECCPVITFDAPFRGLPEKLMTRVFYWAGLSGEDEQHAIALGFGSLYNHNNPANMRYQAIAGSLLQFIAVCDITAGEELTINYNGDKGAHESKEDFWFQRTGIMRLP